MQRFDPDNRQVLLSEDRYRRLPPERILDWLPLRPDATVADIGCGPGFFTLPLAERVPAGVVYAIDTEPVMLDSVRERAAATGLTNIATLQATASALPLAPGSLDGAFLAMTFLFITITDRVPSLARLRESVRPDGWLAILDWEKRQNPGGGPPLEWRVTPEETAAALAAAGWRITARHAPNEWTYLLLATPSAARDERPPRA